MRMCIYGAGAMGTSLGAFLGMSRALGECLGIECDYVSRNRAHVEAMRTNGLIVRWHDDINNLKVSALTPEEMSGEYDIIFLATKQRENPAIADFLLPYLAADGALVTVQNGLPESGLAEVFGANRVYGAALGWGAELESPGVVRITSEPGRIHISLGAYGEGARLKEIAEMINSRGNLTLTVGSLAEIRYSKLVVNASFSTLSVISGLTFGEISRRHKKYALALIREVISVAQAHGCKKLEQNGHDILTLFRSPLASLILPIAMKKHASIRSGMLRDLEAGKRCDIDFVAGAVVKAGREKGIETPLLARAVALVHEIEDGLAEISPESLSLLEMRE